MTTFILQYYLVSLTAVTLIVIHLIRDISVHRFHSCCFLLSLTITFHSFTPDLKPICSTNLSQQKLTSHISDFYTLHLSVFFFSSLLICYFFPSSRPRWLHVSLWAQTVHPVSYHKLHQYCGL